MNINGRITVKDHYGDDVLDQHIESCRECGALVFVPALYAGGGECDTRQKHASWHESMLNGGPSLEDVRAIRKAPPPEPPDGSVAVFIDSDGDPIPMKRFGCRWVGRVDSDAGTWKQCIDQLGEPTAVVVPKEA
jgi:hypothetical protein